MQRQIFTRQFWREFRIDSKRLGRDPRARKAFARRCAALIYCVAVLTYYWFYFSSFHDPATAIALGCVLAVIFLIVGAVRFSHWREAKRQLDLDIASVPAASTALAQRLAHGLAAITQRALGEHWLKNNVVPEGHTVVNRRIQLDTLRDRGVWEQMPIDVRVWMMSPDGSWPETRIARVFSTGETLNTLLWGLALQRSLRPVEDLLTTLSMERFAKLLEKSATGIRPIWDMRVERNRALDYFWRCQTECVHRGYIHAETEEQAVTMNAWVDELEASPQKEFFAGALTVHELDPHALQTAKVNAAYRTTTLGLLMDLLDNADVAEPLTQHVYISLLDPDEPSKSFA